VIFVHFHSVPATTRASIENSQRIVRILTQYQYVSKLYLIPILPLQQEIMAKAPAKYRVLLYRRVMFRLAEMVARREKAVALITGESVGQVASQTLSNIRVINEVVSLPVLRPLAGEDKKDIIDLAKAIGTFEISTEPFEDCCSLFIPRHPETKGDPELIRQVEEKLEMDELYLQAFREAEMVKLKYPEPEDEKEGER
jgi:thiamine biosynthesis protein ThiI